MLFQKHDTVAHISLNRPQVVNAYNIQMRNEFCEVLSAVEQDPQAQALLITGEGRADLSTVFDKAPVGVARHAQAHGVPTVLLAGSLGDGHEELYKHGVASVLCISDGTMTFQQALGRTGVMLEGTAERAVRLFLLKP